MASISQAITYTSKTLASDHLRRSSGSVTGVPLRDLGRNQLRLSKRSDFAVVAKLRKIRKHEYPWPEDPDPNVRGGVLTHLSGFKPLTERPKPVTLDFEKPLIDLQKKIIDVRNMADETGLDFTDQISLLETKYQQALKELYLHLTPIQRVNIARHPNRPTFLDHMFNITEKFVELHGDRAGYDDPAIVTGLGTINGRSYLFIGQQKGRNTKENIARNFGMPTPHGYRKALRMMYYAEHHGFPIVTFIDTPGAYADLKSEELGQGEAIAHNLRTMFGLKVPIISIVMGEGGSGGALAIGCANKLYMLENAVFYVASPEACAAILWKTAKASPKAAEKLKITASELCRLQIADGVIPEPLGGAHADPAWTSQQIKKAIVESMDELVQMDTQELLNHRNMKFRKIGGFQEGIPIDPKRKANMKKKEEPHPNTTLTLELESKVEKIKEQILKAKDSSTETPDSDSDLDEMIEKLQIEVDFELSEAAKALGLKDRFLMLQQEHTKAIHPALLDKTERFKDEFGQRLTSAPNYPNLRYKLDMLKELSMAKKLAVVKNEPAILNQEINKKFMQVLDRPDIKENIEILESEIEKAGAFTRDDLDYELKKKILEVKGKIECEFASALTPLDLDEGIQKRIDDIVDSSDLRNKIDLLKSEATKAEMNSDPESQNKVRVLVREIKQSLANELIGVHEKLNAEIGRVVESNGALSRTPVPSGDVNNRVRI